MTTGGGSTALTPGDVVLVPFPFRDRLAESARPAVVVSTPEFNAHGDVIVAAIMSHGARSNTDYALVEWEFAGLRLQSTVRMLLATLSSRRVLLRTGQLSEGDWGQVQIRMRIALSTA